jgi:predicted DNA-binding transcriptional regulator AlpA
LREGATSDPAGISPPQISPQGCGGLAGGTAQSARASVAFGLEAKEVFGWREAGTTAKGREVVTKSNGGALLNARQVAERLQVSIPWVLAHASGKHKPVLPSLKLGKAVRFSESDIDEFLEHCRRAMAKGTPIQ